jgi:hypothetical protein
MLEEFRLVPYPFEHFEYYLSSSHPNSDHRHQSHVHVSLSNVSKTPNPQSKYYSYTIVSTHPYKTNLLQN